MSLVVKVIARRPDPGAVVAYLASQENHHENQRIVAGSITYPGVLDKALTAQVAADLRLYQQLTGTQVPRGHIYHTALSVSPDMGVLPDSKWASIANDYMQGMGFADPAKSPIRWTAVNHGANGAGADHIHLVMSTIRENGTQVSLHNDMKHASKLATVLERKYALGVLESRLVTCGAGSVPFTGKEVERAKLRNKPEPDRVTLERKIRTLAGASQSEAEFVRLAKADGLLLRPFPETGPVKGYSVGLPGAVKGDFFAGGQLARDLTLPQLRRGWTPQDATASWRGKAQPAPFQRTLSKADVDAALAAMEAELTAAEPEQLQGVSHDLAGSLAAASTALEPTPGPLAKASRDVGAWAQPRAMPTARRNHNSFAVIALLREIDPKMALGYQLGDTLIALYQLHRASRLVAVNGRSTVMTTQKETGLALTPTVMQRLRTGWARDKQALVDSRVGYEPPKAGPRVSEPGQLWDRQSIRDDANAQRVAQVRKDFAERAPRATPGQVERFKELSEAMGVPLPEAYADAVLDQLPRAEVVTRIADMEASLYPEQVAQQEVGLTSATAVGGIRNWAQAQAFLERLESQAGPERLAHLEQEIAFSTAVESLEPPVQITQARPVSGSARDPRTYASAGDPVTNPQRSTLRQKGFTAEQIGTLRKGSASYVIGAEDHYAAFDDNAANPVQAAEQIATKVAQTPTQLPQQRRLQQ